MAKRSTLLVSVLCVFLILLGAYLVLRFIFPQLYVSLYNSVAPHTTLETITCGELTVERLKSSKVAIQDIAGFKSIYRVPPTEDLVRISTSKDSVLLFLYANSP